MKIPRLKKGQLIVIRFMDIEEDPAWQSESQARQRPDSEGVGVGWYLKHDDDFLYVSTQILDSGARNKTTYPIGCVIKIQKAST